MAVLPVFVVQQEELIRRTVWAYLTVWTEEDLDWAELNAQALRRTT